MHTNFKTFYSPDRKVIIRTLEPTKRSCETSRVHNKSRRASVMIAKGNSLADLSLAKKRSNFKYLFEFAYSNKSSILDQLQKDHHQATLTSNKLKVPTNFNKSENFNQELYN